VRNSTAPRAALPFRAVNRSGRPDYDPSLQRHHLLPSQLRSRPAFSRLLAALDPARVGFDDFRRNGLLLPADEGAARRLLLPLHRGPHRDYNRMVSERIGQIEAQWSARRPRSPGAAGEEALFRLALLQRTLRRRLLNPPGRPVRLNRHDPLGAGFDFSELDAMAEQLWLGTREIASASPGPAG
jgi:hypothetical protein